MNMEVRPNRAAINSQTSRATVQAETAAVVAPAMANDYESENVEYLVEEAICDDSTTAAPATFDDTFYPNAIHCLIALYRRKYQEMLNLSKAAILQMAVWPDIAKEMQESYFSFNSWQVQQKFRLLRRQYFSITSLLDIEAFEYFENMHEIYQDPAIDALTKRKAVHRQDSVRISYVDDILHDDVQHVVQSEFKQNPIKTEIKSVEEIANIEINVDTEAAKTLKRDPEIHESEAASSKVFKFSSDMTLRQYNDEQERRHREQMALMQQNVKLQQSILDKIESLIKH